jgi:thioredoxin-like negative regulator of GroEL
MSIPTLVFYKDGEPIKKVVGVHNIDALEEIINTL